MNVPQAAPPDASPPSKNTFTQGVATLFQVVGTSLFLISMFACCSTSLLGKDTATRSGLTTVGWHRSKDPPDQPFYSAQRALTITLLAGLCFGMAQSAVGLGLQAENLRAPILGMALNLLAGLFWIAQSVFFAWLGWVVMSILCTALAIIDGLLLVLVVGASRELRKGDLNHVTEL